MEFTSNFATIFTRSKIMSVPFSKNNHVHKKGLHVFVVEDHNEVTGFI